MFEKLRHGIRLSTGEYPLYHPCSYDRVASLLTTELKCIRCPFFLTDEEKAILNLCNGVVDVIPTNHSVVPFQIRVSKTFIDMYNISKTGFK